MPFLSNISAPNSNPANFRTGIIMGFIIYSLFAILDYYMLPSSYLTAWKIRFLLVGPSLIIPTLLSYSPKFQKYLRQFTIVLIGIAQLGIFLMIFTAKPYEYAYYDYFLGLILVIIWAAFFFKVNYIPLIFLVGITWIIYIFYAVSYQKLLSFGFESTQFASFLNNVMFLISISSLSVLGNYLIDAYYKKIKEEKKNLETALIKAQESDLMKSNFMSTMSHEIRTPLNGIIGFSDIMVHEKHYEDFSMMAEAINRQGHQLLRVVDAILKYTEIQSKSDLKPIAKISGLELQRILKGEFTYYQHKYNKPRISLRFQDFDLIEKKVLSLHGENFIDSAVNIIENAVKFSDSGYFDILFKIINEADLIIRFKDEGIGVDQTKIDDIFKEFYQVESGHNRKFEGIGMGLAFARKLIHLMGGEIWCENNEKEGVSLYIHIPNCVRNI